MKQKKKKNASASSVRSETAGSSAGPDLIDSMSPVDAERARVQSLIARGNSKSAVDVAKTLHARLATAETETILVDAYYARVRSMFEKSMWTEGQSLLAMVVQRHPAHQARFDDLQSLYGVRTGNLDAVIAPLADPNLAVERRAEIERLIRCEITNLDALANTGVLPAEHALRREAAVLSKAFAAVCSGPVDDAVAALPEIPRRSPLAPWKTLIRALAAYYRRDDAAACEHLDHIDKESAPGRVAPVLWGLLRKNWNISLHGLAQRALAQSIDIDSSSLRKRLADLDEAMDDLFSELFIKQADKCLAALKRSRPELAEQFSERLYIHYCACGFPPMEAFGMAGTFSYPDARFWRLLAWRVLHVDLASMACAFWEEFRVHALHEGWFAPGGIEEGALFLFMAEMLARDWDDEKFQESHYRVKTSFSNLDRYYMGDAKALLKAVQRWRDPQKRYWLDPQELYRRACACDPARASYLKWMLWAQSSSQEQADEAFAAWVKGRPHDSEPFLLMLQAAEKRGAFVKALKYLEQAEALDPLNTEVRRARIRLLLARARDHIRAKKPHLLEKDLAALEAHPFIGEGDGPAALCALRWVLHMLAGRLAEASICFADLLDLMPGAVGPNALLSALAALAKIPIGLPSPSNTLNAAVLIESMAGACRVGNMLGVPPSFIDPWPHKLTTALLEVNTGVQAPQARVLAETALDAGYNDLAYAATSAGLRLGGETEARFLILRARSLPSRYPERRQECLRAAVALGRLSRDMIAVDEAVNLLHGARRRVSFLGLDDPFSESEMDLTNARHILADEKSLSDLAGRYVNTDNGEEYSDSDLFFEDDEEEEDDEDERHSLNIEMGMVLFDVLNIVPEAISKMPTPQDLAQDYPEVAEDLREVMARFREERHREPTVADFLAALAAVKEELPDDAF